MLEVGLSPDYVLDEMEVYEIKPLMKRAYLRHRDSWEQTRVLANWIHNAFFKGKFSMKFPWDGENRAARVTKAEVVSLREEGERLAAMLMKKKNKK